MNGSNQVGQIVNLRDGQFGFASSTTSVYQQVAIPVSLFGANSSAVTSVKFQITGNGGTTSIGFYLDGISLQSGFPVAPPVAATSQLFRFNCTGGTANSTTTLSTGDLNCYAPNGPAAGQIVGWETYANASSLATCSFTADIWKKNAGVPAVGQKISASAPISLTTANSSNGSTNTVSTWTRAVAPHDDWNANLATVTGCVYINFSVFYQ